MKKTIGTVFLVVVVLLLGVFAYLEVRVLEGDPPSITPLEVPKVLGKHAVISVKIVDEESGVRLVRAEIVQGGKKASLGSREYPVISRWRGSTEMEVTASWEISPVDLGLSCSDTLIRIQAFDASYRNGARGNTAILEIPIRVDFVPPVVTVLSTVHNIRVGGAGAVSFTASEPTVRAGVRVGKLFFNALRGKDNIYRALIAIPFDMKHVDKLFVEAEDEAGNIGIGGLSFNVYQRKRVVDNIQITDAFLQRKMPEFISRFPEVASSSLIDTFLKVNRGMRKKDNRFLLSLCKDTLPDPLWKLEFKRPAGARRAGFADERHYFYKGREIDRAFHDSSDG